MKRYPGCLCYECKCTKCCWHWDNKCNFKDIKKSKMKIIKPDKIEYVI